MKSFFAVLAFALCSVLTAQAQITVTITNNSNCDYRVKVNQVPTTGCVVLGTGPLIVVAAGTTRTITVASYVGGVAQHVPAFGVNQVGAPCPPVIVGDGCSPYPLSICNYCTCDPCITYGGTPTAPTLTIN